MPQHGALDGLGQQFSVATALLDVVLRAVLYRLERERFVLIGAQNDDRHARAVSLRRNECFPAFTIRQAEIEQDHVDAAARQAV